MTKHHKTDPPPDLLTSPLYLLAVPYVARRSKDRTLEEVTRHRLAALGVRIIFGDELPTPCLPMGEVIRFTPPANTPLLLGAKELAGWLSMSLRAIRTLDAAGKLPAPARSGGRVLRRVDEIRAWLDAGAPDRARWAAVRAAQKRSHSTPK